MITNLKIKRREMFHVQQALIKTNGEFKDVQHRTLLALNECFACEFYERNSLVKGVASLKLKNVSKEYARVYKRKLELEEHLEQLKNWQPKKEEGDE